jgi:hypothetical protein
MSNNTKLGVGALNNNNGSKNTAIGAYASYKNTVGFSNTSLGVNAGFFNETGDWNTSLGSAALCNNLNGSSNTAIGSNALLGTETLSIGNHNTGVGVQSLEENTGDFNTALGAQSGLDLSGSSYNTYLGAKTNASSQGLNHSTAIGYEAKITDSNQIMMGTTTETVQVPGQLDVSGQSTFHTDLKVRGVTVGRGVSTQNTNVVFGGRNALESMTTGGENVAIGENALSVNNKYGNTAVGYNSLINATGASSTALGRYSGENLKNGEHNTFLGDYADVNNSANFYKESTAIGFSAKITGSNQIMMGTANETVQVPGTLNVDGPAYLTNYVNQGNPEQVVPKSYVDAIASGIVPTQSCLCATTTNINLSSTTIPAASNTDGVDLSSLSDGSYNILVRAQANKIENGVYFFTKNGGSGTWVRPTSPEPMYNGFDANAAFSFVVSGTTYGKIGLVQILKPAIVGTDELEYTEFYQLQVNAGEGLNTTGQSGQLYINVDTSLNIVEYLDNNAGDLHLGAGDTTGNVVIGEENINQTTTIQNQANFVQNEIIVGSGINNIDRNILIGSGPNDISGNIIQNIRFGRQCLDSGVLSGKNNIAIGHRILRNLTTGEQNVFIGTESPGENITDSSYNVGIGAHALRYYNGEEGKCTAIGYKAGRNAKGGHSNTFLGGSTDFDNVDAEYSWSTAVGYGAIITDTNQIMMGTPSKTIEIPGTVSYQTYRQPIIFSCTIGRNTTDISSNNGYYIKDGTNFGINTVENESRGVLTVWFVEPTDSSEGEQLNNKKYKVMLTGAFNDDGNKGSVITFAVTDADEVNYTTQKFNFVMNNLYTDDRTDLEENNTGAVFVTVYYYP